MTEEQIERIAELVFQKLVKKQEEWDKQFAEEIRDQVVMDIVIKEKQLPDIDTRINNLQAHLERLLEKELYTEAAAVKERIDELKKELE
jgi:N-glycosylase/DNA lyase